MTPPIVPTANAVPRPGPVGLVAHHRCRGGGARLRRHLDRANPHRALQPGDGHRAQPLRGLAAILFGLGMWYFAGRSSPGEFFAGWLTEYSLSVDNLFVFLLIMAKFAVPRSSSSSR